MLLGARQFFERRGAPTPPLPYDAEVEYLESTGTQYIDTGVVPNNNRGFEIDFAYVGEGGTYGRVFGTQVNGYSGSVTIRRVNSNSGNVMIQNLGGSWAGVSDIPFDTNRHAVAINAPQGTVSFDSNVITQSMAFSVNFSASCWLFCNNNVSTQCGIMRLYGYKCVDHSTGKNLQDMIPVRVGSGASAVGFMYERVSGQLFRNAGTGAFTIGPDKTAWTNPYVTNGLVAMWDGKWNAGWGVHDANATVWKDLVGGYDFAIPSPGASLSDDCVTLNNSSLSTSLQEVARPDFTIECVAESVGNSGAWLWMKNPSWIGGALIGWQQNGRCYFPWYEIGNLGGTGLASAVLAWDSSNQVLYKDASAIASTARSIDSRNVLSSIYIGEYNGDKKTTMNCYCIRLYSRALTAAEVAANYAIDKARFNLP